MSEKNHVTLKDVARAAGVSPSTVSRVLSGKIPVDPKTERRIRDEIEKLGYVPNYLAKSLKEGSGHTIGLIVPDITNPVFPAVALGAETEAVRNGYQLFLAHSHEDEKKEAVLAQLLIQHGAAGLLVATACRGSSFPEECKKKPVCQVVRLQTADVPSVTADQVMIGKLAAGRFLSIGCRHPAILAGDRSLALHRDRLAGFVQTMKNSGVNDIQIIDSSDPDEDGRFVTEQLLTTKGLEIDSIFAASDMQALGVVRTLWLHHIPVPEKIAVIGVDNLGISTLCTPPITCIRQPLQEIGRLSCSRLISFIERQRTQKTPEEAVFENSFGSEHRHLVLPCELVMGETA